MNYSKEVLSRARAILAQKKADRESENAARLQAAYARMPRLKRWLRRGPMEKILPVAQRIKTALGGWLKAQLKLAGLCFCVVCGGFLLLRIPYAPIWAALTALVDAIPVLGTGAVLIPWSLVCLLQGQRIRALGLAAIYVIALISRSALEPRLVGKQLGLDPLLTLGALYAGYRLWGILGMLAAPIIAVAGAQLVEVRSK